MRKHLLILILFAITLPSIRAQVQCYNDSTGLIPLIDLGADYYLGKQGGLYPGGSNLIPSGHLKAGQKIAKGIKPLDTLGNVDWINGKVVFLGMGASTAGNTWNHFVDIVDTAAGLNPCMQVINACLGAKGLEIMNDTTYNNWYWTDNIMPKIRMKGSTPAQVQAVWVKTASKVDTTMIFPSQPEGIADKYEILMGVLHNRFPNLKMVFISGFFYGGYADTLKEFYDVVSEPGSYWNSFAVKWVVERQIMGDPDLKFTGPTKRSPFIAWGPYVWADGNNPNSEGLFWNCEADFAWDGGGYHLTNLGKDKEAHLLLTWAKNNPVVKRWFLDNPKWNSCDPFGRTSDGRPFDTDENTIETNDQNISLYPSPNDGNFYIQLNKPETGYQKVIILNTTGQVVFENAFDANYLSKGLHVDITGYPSGIYFATLNINGQLFTKEFIKQ